jgi:glycosyltransferase involved in cell wall biosynthesis
MSPAHIAGVTWGDPRAVTTYSGVPRHLFDALDPGGCFVGAVDARCTRPTDLLHGAIAWRRTLAAGRPRRTTLWRYLPSTSRRLSPRLAAALSRLGEHDVVLQFGVAGRPPGDVPLVAHVEITLATALESDSYASSYGLHDLPEAQVTAALEGEREFLDACTLVWTNTTWTARGLLQQGVDPARIRVQPPGCAMPDPGVVERAWDACRILFVGKDWGGKGGPLLLEAFRLLRRTVPDAELTVVGCRPDVEEPGVRVLGFLSKDDPVQAELLHRAYTRATVFAMPSYWESTGVVYLEAALYGLPIVMLRGQGRDELFPRSMSVQLDEPSPDALAWELAALAGDPTRALRMGAAGRTLVLLEYPWTKVAGKVQHFANEALHLSTGGPATSPTNRFP